MRDLTGSGPLDPQARRDRLTILSGTGQNMLGLAVYVLATFGTNVLVSRALGAPGLGVVTLAAQFAFIAGAATRFGMDMAAVRLVAIDLGKGQPGRVRGVVSRAGAIAAVASVVIAVPVVVWAGSISQAFVGSDTASSAFRAAGLAIPFVAMCQVVLGGTRGLKIMRHTLSVYWVGQPLSWVALLLLVWAASRSVGASVVAYAGSWLLATVAAWLVWRRETHAFGRLPPEPRTMEELVRYGAPRAPAALLSQLLFWADYFVLAIYVRSATELGVYAAAVRVSQTLALFLTAVNYMFSPFVADLHARGERGRLDELYKSLTRWMVAGTIPLLLVLLILPEAVLKLFGAEFDQGTAALRILLIGQAVNVAVGSVGFILIMVGRTGWDLLVYALAFSVDLTVAFILAPRLGAEGAAVAQAVTLVVSNVGRLLLVWRFVRIQPFTPAYARLVLPALAGGVVMVAAHAAVRGAAWPVDLAVSGAAGTLAYVAALIPTGLTAGERQGLARLVRRIV